MINLRFNDEKQTNKQKQKTTKKPKQKKMKTQSNILSDEHTLKQCLF